MAQYLAVAKAKALKVKAKSAKVTSTNTSPSKASENYDIIAAAKNVPTLSDMRYINEDYLSDPLAPTKDYPIAKLDDDMEEVLLSSLKIPQQLQSNIFRKGGSRYSDSLEDSNIR